MSKDRLQSPKHNAIRTALRVGGPIVLALGLIFSGIGLMSFFSSFGSFEPPRYFWCAFVGFPLLALGAAMTQFGYLGAFYRYVAGETAPVAKDAFNDLAEGVQPGVKSIAKSITAGIVEGQRAEPPRDAD